MSGFRSQGVGAAACAKAVVVSAVSAAAKRKLLVENPFIVILPAAEISLSCPVFGQITNVVIPSMAPSLHHRALAITSLLRLCDFPHGAWRLCSPFDLETLYCEKPHS